MEKRQARCARWRRDRVPGHLHRGQQAAPSGRQAAIFLSERPAGRDAEALTARDSRSARAQGIRSSSPLRTVSSSRLLASRIFWAGTS